MEMLADEKTERRYRFWLHELDAHERPPPRACETVDELLRLLLARWNRDGDSPADQIG